MIKASTFKSPSNKNEEYISYCTSSCSSKRFLPGENKRKENLLRQLKQERLTWTGKNEDMMITNGDEGCGATVEHVKS